MSNYRITNTESNQLELKENGFLTIKTYFAIIAVTLLQTGIALLIELY